MLPKSIFYKLESILTYEQEFRFDEIIGAQFKFDNKRDIEKKMKKKNSNQKLNPEIKTDSFSGLFDRFKKKNKKIEIKPEKTL